MSLFSASTLTTATGAGALASPAGVEFVPYSACDFLLTWSTDIRLYRITEKEQTANEALAPSLGFRLSSRRIAEISNFIPKTPRLVKCVSVGSVKGTIYAFITSQSHYQSHHVSLECSMEMGLLDLQMLLQSPANPA